MRCPVVHPASPPSFPRRRESRDLETVAPKNSLRGGCTTRDARPFCVSLDSHLRGNDVYIGEDLMLGGLGVGRVT